jgi:SpoIID/LytB domain protein
MPARTVALSLATIPFLLAACDQTQPASQLPLLATHPAPLVAQTKPATPATKPVQLTKPPLLGPPGPAIVILPDHIDQPQIRVRLTAEEDRPPAVAKTKYRGRIETLRMPDGKYIAINILPLDSYLQGVLAKELYGSWDPATYRAQAIAARTFALFTMLTDGRGKQWDVNDDESSQMYGGIAGESAKARAAVADTRGQVLFASLNGKQGIFCSRYSACIGGASQDPFDAWGDSTIGPLSAHLTGTVDENCDKFTWNRDFVVSKTDLSRCIKNWGEKNDFPHLQALGRIESVAISKRNPATNRPTEMLLTDFVRPGRQSAQALFQQLPDPRPGRRVRDLRRPRLRPWHRHVPMGRAKPRHPRLLPHPDSELLLSRRSTQAALVS